MGFIFAKSLGGEMYPIVEKKPTTASETYTTGEALVLSSGALTKCGATTKPTYIAARSYVAPASGNEDLEVNPILPEYIYQSTFSADPDSINIGDKVTIASDGLRVTATTSSGVATVDAKLDGGNDTGDGVTVRFI